MAEVRLTDVKAGILARIPLPGSATTDQLDEEMRAIVLCGLLTLHEWSQEEAARQSGTAYRKKTVIDDRILDHLENLVTGRMEGYLRRNLSMTTVAKLRDIVGLPATSLRHRIFDFVSKEAAAAFIALAAIFVAAVVFQNLPTAIKDSAVDSVESLLRVDFVPRPPLS